jgi:ATP-dependent exoDNAse (exonuclease V) alpha subunit
MLPNIRAHLGVAHLRWSTRAVAAQQNQKQKPELSPMAIYHLSVKPISRSKGRCATAAAAYRSGCKIKDERTGEIYDYSRKKGILSVDIVLPMWSPDWAKNRSQLWNASELAEKRKDACVAREFEVALPCELSHEEHRKLVLAFAQEMADSEGCAVDVAIHDHGKDGDERNVHAHILRTTRKVSLEGLGEKLDTEKAGRKRADDLDAIRSRWAEMTNERLQANGIAASVDHRSLEDQGIDRAPTRHLGVAATGFERRTGAKSRLRIAHEEEQVLQRMASKEVGELEHQAELLDRSIIDLTGDLQAAEAERSKKAALDLAASGVADFKAKFEAEKAKALAAKKVELEQKRAEPEIEPDRSQEMNRTPTSTRGWSR